MAAPASPTLQASVGRELRAGRERAGLGLRELARRRGISASALSQIETGRSRPSVGTLYAIVTELDMSLDALFSRRRAPLETPRSVVQRGADRPAIELESGVRWERLTPAAEGPYDFLYLVYELGGASTSDGQLISHSGREYGLVLDGTLEVTVGDEVHLLEAGDSISFDSTIAHRLRNAGDEPAEAVWFTTGRAGDTRPRP